MEAMHRAIFFMMADLYLLGDELPAQKLWASNLSNRGEAKLSIDLAERVSVEPRVKKLSKCAFPHIDTNIVKSVTLGWSWR